MVQPLNFKILLIKNNLHYVLLFKLRQYSNSLTYKKCRYLVFILKRLIFQYFLNILKNKIKKRLNLTYF